MLHETYAPSQSRTLDLRATTITPQFVQHFVTTEPLTQRSAHNQKGTVFPKLDLVGFIVGKGRVCEEVFNYTRPVCMFTTALAIEDRQHFSFS
jgi:hypothetical protein